MLINLIQNRESRRTTIINFDLEDCGTIDVRNSPSAIFEQLSQELLKRYKNCTVIEGDVRFLVMTNESLTTEDFESSQMFCQGHSHKPSWDGAMKFVRFYSEKVLFPLFKTHQFSDGRPRLLKESSLGITSLSYIFPELRIIRGRSLVHNYALVLFQNEGLMEIGLPNLFEISHGSVRIAENPRLCYAETVNWSAICRQANLIPSVIETNSDQSTFNLLIIRPVDKM
uniref:Receptor L-domain domain-containing protein n=1 Tax=Romanomermis culicivorax TaxID=13658 RepID=A0A915IAB7_ROMCU